MSIATNIGPCKHGVVENVCWRCTSNNIGILRTAIERLRCKVFRLRWVYVQIVKVFLGHDRFVTYLENRLRK